MSAFTLREKLAIVRVLIATYRERVRQQRKWGQQNHADGTGPDVLALANIGHTSLETRSAKSLARIFTDTTDEKFHPYGGWSTPSGAWLDIFLEEVFESLAESDETSLTTELVQVMAVSSAWIEAIDRRQAV